jgi:hypothetical protein
MQLRLLDVETDIYMGLFPMKQKAGAGVAFYPSRHLCQIMMPRFLKLFAVIQ